MPIPSDGSNFYGSTTTTQVEDEPGLARHTFSIAEPSYADDGGYGARRGQAPAAGSSSSSSLWHCCRPGTKSGDHFDGLRIIVMSMFIFSVGVTAALVIQIISDNSPTNYNDDQVISSHDACTSIGQEILKLGGNAVDSAVAATLCTTMLEPHISGIGGGGFMMIHKHRSNKTIIIDFRETAPASLKTERFLQNPAAATSGRLSVGVPGLLAGLEYAVKKYGSGHFGLDCCQWSDLVWKTIQLVTKGVKVSDHFVLATQSKLVDNLQTSENANLREFAYPKGKQVSTENVYNDVPTYTSLINTLKVIADNGSAALYHGPIGQAIVDALNGWITMDDLASYNVIEREAISTRIGDYEVIASPSPSGGPELLAFLNTMEVFNGTHGLNGVDSKYLSTLAKVFRRVHKFQLGLGDPGNETFVQDRTNWMINKESAERILSERGQPGKFGSSYNQPESIASTVAVMDVKDNYVSVVTSLNSWFGSKIMTDNGILLNNAMSNFLIPTDSSNDPSTDSANLLAALKRPLSNNVVALAMDVKNICGRRILVGGPTAQSVGQVLYDPLLLHGELQTSTTTARIIVRNDTVFIENGLRSFPSKVLADFQQNFEPDSQYLKLPYPGVLSLDKNLDQILAIQDIRSKGDDDPSEEEENDN